MPKKWLWKAKARLCKNLCWLADLANVLYMLEKTVNQCGMGYYPFPAFGLVVHTGAALMGHWSIQWQTIWSQWCSGSAWVSWIDLWGLLFAAGMKLTQMAANGNISALTKINKNSWQMECASSAKRMQWGSSHWNSNCQGMAKQMLEKASHWPRAANGRGSTAGSLFVAPCNHAMGCITHSVLAMVFQIKLQVIQIGCGSLPFSSLVFVLSLWLLAPHCSLALHWNLASW